MSFAATPDPSDSPSLSERTGLLHRDPGEEDAGTAYASDGETPRVEMDNKEEVDEENGVQVEHAGSSPGEREGRGRRRRRGHPTEEEEEEQEPAGERSTNEGEKEEITCGLKYCCQKLLNLLPSIGEDEEEGSEAFESALRYGAKQIIQLIVPVTICMAVVVVFELSVALNQPQNNVYFIYIPFQEDEATSGGQTFLFALVNALVVVAIVVVMTIILVLLFKYRCYRAIQVWLFLASGSLLFIFSSLYFIEILMVHNLAADWFSFSFWMWNFGVMGLIVIHWKGPLRLQQAYLILVSALVATRFLKYLPDWTTWLLLAAISIYDLFAVLCPKGPLRVLVETARERNEQIFPALIYSSTMVWIVGMADRDDSKGGDRGKMPKGRPHKKSAATADRSSSSDTDTETDRQVAAREMVRSQENPDRRYQSPTTTEGGRGAEEQGGRRQPPQNEEEEDEEPRGFKLGLGDFIFYSILVGRAAHDSNGDWVIISSCFVAILIGLCLTSLILGIVRRALPALPISIFFGLMFYFSSRYLITDFVAVLATTQVFI